MFMCQNTNCAKEIWHVKSEGNKQMMLSNRNQTCFSDSTDFRNSFIIFFSFDDFLLNGWITL